MISLAQSIEAKNLVGTEINELEFIHHIVLQDSKTYFQIVHLDGSERLIEVIQYLTRNENDFTNVFSKEDFQKFVSECSVSFDMEENVGSMMDSDLNDRIGFVNYESDTIEVEDQIYINEDDYFFPNQDQKDIIIEEIEKQTFLDRDSANHALNNFI